MTTEVPQALLVLLRQYEGLARVGPDRMIRPYLCPAGYPTQGYGRVVSSLACPPITADMAEAWLLNDAAKHLALAVSISPSLRGASEGLRAAIGSFVFNLGPGRYRASTLRHCVDAGRLEDVPAELRKWVFAGGRKLPGLVARREAEALLSVQ